MVRLRTFKTPLAIACLAALVTGCPEEPPVIPLAAAVPSKGVVPVDFKLKGEPRITRHTNVHVPVIGGMGKDSYRLRGELSYDGHSIRIDLTREPLALCRADGDYFLLTQDYFRRLGFRWHTLDADAKAFRQMPPALSPATLLTLTFDDPSLTAEYRAWCVLEQWKNGKSQRAFRLLKQAVAENPRIFFYEQSVYATWDAESPTNEVRLAAYVSKIEEETQSADPDARAELWNIWTRLLSSTRPTDSHQLVNELARFLHRIDKRKTETYLEAWEKRLKETDAPGENRLEGIDEYRLWRDRYDPL